MSGTLPVNPDSIAQFVSITGVDAAIASQIMRQCNNDLNLAVSLYFENNDTLNAQVNTSITHSVSSTREVETSSEDEESLPAMKMVIVVNNSAAMSAGKIAAQCVHAALGATRNASSTAAGDAYVTAWEESGEKVVVVKCDSAADFAGITAAALAQGLPVDRVCDAGRTEVAPGTETAVAIGPGPEEVVDLVTRRFALL